MPPAIDTRDKKRPVIDSSLYDAVIIGGGPAGLSAALVLGRCVRRVAVCDSGRYRNERSSALHCFMSRDGIPPSSLLEESRRQLERYDTVAHAGSKVTAFERRGAQFAVVTDDGRVLQARTLLVANGVVDDFPGWKASMNCSNAASMSAPIATAGNTQRAGRRVRAWRKGRQVCDVAAAMDGRPRVLHRRQPAPRRTFRAFEQGRDRRARGSHRPAGRQGWLPASHPVR
jgi:glycine/D-amino acid oxidase-like deaminating enzyme